VKSRLIAVLAGSAAMALLPSTALAQRQAPPTPDQRIDRLERQVQQMQRQLFPKGRPADTAGFSDDPAATQSSVVTLDQRLDALEKLMSDLVRQSEENGNRLRSLESGLSQTKADQDQRISALEQRMSQAATAAPAETSEPAAAAPAKPKPTPPKTPPKTSAATPPASGPAPAIAASLPAVDEGEDAYTQGFHLWEEGQYDQSKVPLSQPMTAVLGLLDALAAEFTVDPSKILIAGLSMGGDGEIYVLSKSDGIIRKLAAVVTPPPRTEKHTAAAR